MKTSIQSKSDSIQVVYDNYVKGLFIVNRRYQRKLVWTQDEKIAFINSIYNHYSVPLILLANVMENEIQKYEIIDGMQRLNAICSFIENEFPLVYNDEESYFNLDTLASTIDMKEKGELKQKEPILPREICMEIVSNYQLPISYVTADKENIEEIFRRINSFGHQLSKQEIRQAGALGAFPQLVRKSASEIRGDSSDNDILPLNRMKMISLSNAKLNYGIRMEETFWVKQKIVTVPNMRVSRDEELIAYLLLYIIMGEKINPSSANLDKYYDFSPIDVESNSSQLEDKINNYGQATINKWFIKVFNELRKIIETSKQDFRTLIFSQKEGEGLIRTFQIIYLALFELLIRENKKIVDYDALASKLKGIGNQQLKGISDNIWNAQYRNDKISAIKGIISKYFADKIGSDVTKEDWSFQLEAILRKSTIEGAQYDYKMGFHNLDNHDSILNQELVLKCIKILTAAVNKAPKTKAYVVVGITEGKESLEKFRKHYSISSSYSPFGNTNFYITGLNAEINKYYGGDGDKFIREIKSVINKAKIEEQYRSEILSNLLFINYQNKDILILCLESNNSPVSYDNKFYIREGNDTKEIIGADKTMALMSRFLKTELG